jgi:hypothetical protein
MKLSRDTTIISPEKLRDYVINASHPDGESKARFLQSMGYEQHKWKTLEHDLRTQHLTHDVISGHPSEYGQKYEIRASLRGPNGTMRWCRSIWMIRHYETIARFITLIPEKQP